MISLWRPSRHLCDTVCVCVHGVWWKGPGARHDTQYTQDKGEWVSIKRTWVRGIVRHLT